MNKVDVIINVYGKPYQTACTLKSLMLHSGHLIDKIYFIEERNQPYKEKLGWVVKQFTNIIRYKPKYYKFIQSDLDFSKPSSRFSIRYQYGIECSDKDFVFILHNDVLFTGNIIGEMLNEIGDSAGIGQIGQCWNCPAFTRNLCKGDSYRSYKPSYEEVVELINSTPSPRTRIADINKTDPTPLPECRLNEWACLINKKTAMKECKPTGNSPLFGLYDIIDLGVGWFRDLNLKGYTFKNYEKNFNHGYWANNAGYPTQLNKDAYFKAEENAKVYFNTNFLNNEALDEQRKRDNTITLSIIMPTFNSAANVLQSIESIVAQTFYNWELIVMDGQSTDGTIDLVKAKAKQDSRIRLFSEKDQGVYDAMNKGIDKSKGEWIYFLGCDDKLFDDIVLESIFSGEEVAKNDMVYGDVYSKRFGGRYAGEFTIGKLIGQNICHQAIFYKKNIFYIIGKYNTRYIFLGDWEYNFRVFSNSKIKKTHIDRIIADYADKGLSSTKIDAEFQKDRFYIIYKSAVLGKVRNINLSPFFKGAVLNGKKNRRYDQIFSLILLRLFEYFKLLKNG